MSYMSMWTLSVISIFQLLYSEDTVYVPPPVKVVSIKLKVQSYVNTWLILAARPGA